MLHASLFGLVAVFAGGTPAAAATVQPQQFAEPYIELWTSGDVLRRGNRAHVWFQTDVDAYVTVLRIDTDGRVRVLFPREPWLDNLVPGGYRVAVSAGMDGFGEHAFIVDDYPGQGYVFAIASYEPFEYRRIVRGDAWDYRTIGLRGEVTGDPYVAVMDIIDEISLDPYAVSYDVYPYYVERRYEYPRFLCYDCHEHVPYTRWDPYRYSCVRFRIVVHDDPYYYPTRVYRGSRVVYTRPHRIEPRYVFKDREPGTPYVTRARRPEVRDDRRDVVRESGNLGGRRRSPVASPRSTREGGDRALDQLRRQMKPVPKAPGLDTRRRVAPADTSNARPRPTLERRTPTRTPPAARRSPPTRPADKPARKPVIKPKPSGAQRGTPSPPARSRRPSPKTDKPDVRRRKPKP